MDDADPGSWYSTRLIDNFSGTRSTHVRPRMDNTFPLTRHSSR